MGDTFAALGILVMVGFDSKASSKLLVKEKWPRNYPATKNRHLHCYAKIEADSGLKLFYMPSFDFSEEHQKAQVYFTGDTKEAANPEVVETSDT